MSQKLTEETTTTSTRKKNLSHSLCITWSNYVSSLIIYIINTWMKVTFKLHLNPSLKTYNFNFNWFDYFSIDTQLQFQFINIIKMKKNIIIICNQQQLLPFTSSSSSSTSIALWCFSFFLSHHFNLYFKKVL